MRCRACDCELSDYEATRKDNKGVYLDLCGSCFFAVRDDTSLEWDFDLDEVPTDSTEITEVTPI